MNTQHYEKIWAFVALVLVFYSVNTYLSSQGAETVLNIKLLDERRIPGAVFGFFVCSLLLIFLLNIGISFARLKQSEVWQARIPTLFFDDLNHNLKSAKLYQHISIFVVLVLPSLSLVHFVRIILNANIFIDKEYKLKILALDTYNSKNVVLFFNNDTRIGDSYCEGITWFPIAQPFLIIILSIILIYFWIKFMKTLKLKTVEVNQA